MSSKLALSTLTDRLTGSVLSHWRFFRRHRVLRRREAAAAFGLATLAVFAEAGGMAMLAPLLKFIEQGKDVAKFAASSKLAGGLVDFYSALGVPVTQITLSLSIVLLILVRQIMNYANMLATERGKWTIGTRLSAKMLHAVLSSAGSHIREYKPGEFAVKVDTECHAAAAVFRVYSGLWMGAMAFLGYSLVLLFIAPLGALFAFALTAAAMLSMRSLMRETRRLSTASIDARKETVDFVHERFRGWKLIKLADTLEQELETYRKTLGKMVASQLGIVRVNGAAMLAHAPIVVGLILGIIYVFVEVLGVDIATIMVFVLVLIRLAPLTRTFQGQLLQLAQFDSSVAAVDRALRAATAMAEPIDRGRKFRGLEREIEIRDVSFQYPGRTIAALKDLSFTIPAGSFTAIVGPSGAGKSTVVDLIPRLIEPSSGCVLMDGVPATEFSLRSLRAQIAYVSQDPFLFDAPLVDNIRYLRRDATFDEVRAAARLASAEDFIEQLPQGFATMGGDAGMRLSGGQRQRIVLARAFLARPSILILDEPTSALDYETEEAVRKGLEELRSSSGLTLIVIAHRLSTVRRADHVVHMRDGTLFRQGLASDILRDIDKPEDLLGMEVEQPSV